MFGKLFCVFLVMCGYMNSAVYTRDIFIRNSSSDIQIKLHKFPNVKLVKTVPAIKNDGTRTKKISKRGIVMVDSDFDIPSEMYENELEIGDVFEENEGSGTDEYNGEQNNSTEDDSKLISELQKITNFSTVLIPSTTKLTKPTTEKMQIVTSITTEGSGDDASFITEELLNYSTKEVSTKSSTTSGYEIHEKIPDVCMNSTCETNDLLILTSEERSSIPEGVNFTLTCKSNNHSLDSMLYWYKDNGSEYFLQTLGTNAQLHLNIPNTKLIHSGIYVCVKQISKQTCCNINLNLVIYEMPFYQYHLIIIGLVALASILLCILLSVQQSITMKKYTKEFAQKHGKFKSLL